MTTLKAVVKSTVMDAEMLDFVLARTQDAINVSTTDQVCVHDIEAIICRNLLILSEVT